MDETDALPAGIAAAETADGGSGYRIACAALLGAAVLSGLYAALILAGVLEKRCWLLETTGRECIACGCTRDFARLQSVPPIFDKRTGLSSPAPMYLLTRSSWVAGT